MFAADEALALRGSQGHRSVASLRLRGRRRGHSGPLVATLPVFVVRFAEDGAQPCRAGPAHWKRGSALKGGQEKDKKAPRNAVCLKCEMRCSDEKGSGVEALIKGSEDKTQHREGIWESAVELDISLATLGNPDVKLPDVCGGPHVLL